MAIEIKDNVSICLQSLYYFLINEQYVKDGQTKTLKGHFPNLQVILGFPDNIESLSLPTLSITQVEAAPVQEMAMGSNLVGQEYAIELQGFSGGEAQDPENKLQRDRLFNDLKGLFEKTEYVDLYEYPNFTDKVGELEVLFVSGRYLEPTGEMTAERHRFIVELSVSIVTSD